MKCILICVKSTEFLKKKKKKSLKFFGENTLSVVYLNFAIGKDANFIEVLFKIKMFQMVIYTRFSLSECKISVSGTFWINWKVFRIVNKTFRLKNIKWTMCYRAAFPSYMKLNGIVCYHAEFSLHLPIPCCMNEFCKNMDSAFKDILLLMPLKRYTRIYLLDRDY